MRAAWAWVRPELRGRLRASLAIVLLVGISAGVALTAIAGAERADTAFARFAAMSRTATHRLQYSSLEDIDGEVMRRLLAEPSVEAAVPLYFTVALSEDSEYDIGVVSSPDPGLLRDVDKPRLLHGRLPHPDAVDEVVINEFLSRTMGVGVGDKVTLSTFSAEQLAEEAFGEELAGPTLELEVVGVGRLPDDVADDENALMLASAAYQASVAGEAGQFGPSVELIVEPGADIERIVDDALAGFTLEETPQIEPLAALHDRVRDGTQVIAIGLVLFGACAALAALVASTQAVNRRLAALGADQTALQSMGFTRAQRASGLMLLAAPIIAAGAIAAVGVAILGSLFMPMGVARRAEPTPGVDIDVAVLGLGVLVVVLLLGVGALVSALRLTSPHAAARADHGAGAPLRQSMGAAVATKAGWSPPAVLGISMALEPGRGRTAVPVRPALAGAVLGITGVVAALTFGTSLDHLVSTPAAYGWNWSVSPDLFEGDADALAESDAIRDVGLLLFRQTEVEGQALDGMAVQPVKGSPSLTVLAGRMPATPDEVALGPKTLDDLHVAIGDQVSVATNDDSARKVTVVGEVLFPVFDENPFNAGVAFHPDLLGEVELSDGFGASLVRFAPGVTMAEGEAAVASVAPDSLSVYAYPSKPSDVGNLDQVRSIPLALAGFLVMIAVAAVGHALITSVRRRRRDIGIVRALGFRRRQVLATVAVQSTTLAVVGLLLGVPLGMVAGRAAWSVVAEGLGVATSPTVPVGILLALVPGALSAAAAMAMWPAQAAARVRAVEALRAE